RDALLMAAGRLARRVAAAGELPGGLGEAMLRRAAVAGEVGAADGNRPRAHRRPFETRIDLRRDAVRVHRRDRARRAGVAGRGEQGATFDHGLLEDLVARDLHPVCEDRAGVADVLALAERRAAL